MQSGITADACLLLLKINALILNPLIGLLFGVALLVFFWGIVEFINNADGTEGRQQGKRHLLWGIIGMVVMFGVFGILQIGLNTFGITVPSCV